MIVGVGVGVVSGGGSGGGDGDGGVDRCRKMGHMTNGHGGDVEMMMMMY